MNKDNKRNLIKSVCWDITSACNENCAFCYRNADNMSLSLEDNKRILKKLIDIGVGKISIVGGEPLLYDDLFELVRWGREYGGKGTVFSITTNGIRLTEIVNDDIEINQKIVAYLNELFGWITFSLDGIDTESQRMVGRNDRHFDRIMKLLDYISKTTDLKIKINTMVCRQNIDRLPEMLLMLDKKEVMRWKLFRFLPSRGSAADNRDLYYIEEEEFDDAMDDLKKCQ